MLSLFRDVGVKMTNSVPGSRIKLQSFSALLVGILSAGALNHWANISVAVVWGWNIAALVLLSLTWKFIAFSSAAEARHRAVSEDPGRRFIWIVLALLSVLSFFAAAFVLRDARRFAPQQEGLLILGCLAAVTFSWFLSHTFFTLRYARLYYGQKEGGLNFPGGEAPDELDFAYFSFTLGMTFQVSDIAITGREIRRLVLIHSLLSFAFNSVLIALTLNLFFGILGAKA